MKRANTSRLTATTSRRLWMRSSAPAEASQFGHSWAILYYPSLRRPSRDSKGPVKAGLASRGRTTHKGLAKVSGLRCAARHGSRNSAASRDFCTLIVPWIMLNGPVQWLCQCLGVCHGAITTHEPLRGVGDPRHLRGERAAAAPAPRALTRIGFITVPRKAPPRATRYGRATLAHKAIACPGASASAAASPAQAA
jgi:hypothetical protein